MPKFRGFNHFVVARPFAKTLLLLFVSFYFLSLQSFSQGLVLDKNFSAGATHAYGEVLVSVVQPDGKILVGGKFNVVNGIRQRYLTRLNPDGSTDFSFNPGGIGPDGYIYDIVSLASGKILIAGNFYTYNGRHQATGIIRLNSDGTLDPTFSHDGLFFQGVASIALQPDGKIIVGGLGDAYIIGSTIGRLLRLEPDGSRDISLQVDIRVAGGLVTKVAVDSNGNILLATSGSIGYNGLFYPLFLMRFSANGLRDASFNAGGQGANAPVYSLVIQPDSKIVISGNFSFYNSTTRTLIARLNVDGTLDSSFIPPTYPEFSDLRSIVVLSNGQLLAAGTIYQTNTFNPNVIRLNSNGSEDNSFVVSTDNVISAVTLQADGSFLLAGRFGRLSTGENRNGIVRYFPTGVIDTLFDPAFTDYGSITAMLRQPDGKLLVAGNFSMLNGNIRYNVGRFNADGTLDNTFAVGSGPFFADTDFDEINAIAVQPDGKILVGGCFRNFSGSGRDFVVRLNADGSVDTAFSVSGVTFTSGSRVLCITVLPDSKVLIAGSSMSTAIAPIRNRNILRLNSNGSLDTTFNSSGTNNFGTLCRTLLLPTGKIMIAGNFSTYNGISRPGIARLNSDGSLDPSFTTGTGAASGILSVGLQQDGKILIGGGFSSYNGTAVNRIARLNIDGPLDTSFNVGTGPDSGVNDIAIQQDGKIVIGGLFTNVNGYPQSYFARLNSTGSLEPQVTSGFTSADNNYSRRVNSLVLDQNGGIYLGGGFSMYGNTVRNNIVRLVDGVPSSTPTVIPTPNCTPTNIIQDGAFTSGGVPSSIWNNPQSSTNFGTPLCNSFSLCGDEGGASSPRSHDSWAWFGGASSPETATLGQSVTIPTGTAHLHFFMRIGTVSSPFTDVLNIQIDNITVKSYPEPSAPELDYTERVIDISQFANGNSHNVKFEYIGPTNSTASYVIDDVSLLSFQCSAPSVVTGAVPYANAIGQPAGRFVSNVLLSGSGSVPVSALTSFPSGSYTLSGFGSGAYTVTPSKAGGINGAITSFDAAKIAQHVAGINSLTGNQFVVADVSGNGTLTSFDAAQIARYVAGLPGSGSTASWIFSPVSRTYASVTTNISGEDYSALLMGEVSGNWTNSGARPSGGIAANSDLDTHRKGEAFPHIDGQSPEMQKQENGIEVALPSTIGTIGKEVIVPVSVKGIADKGVFSYEFDLRYDPSVIQPQTDSVDLKGTVSRGLVVVTNSTELGLLRVVVYGAFPIDQDGVLLNLRFTSVGKSGSLSLLSFERFMFNEGLPMTVTNGQVELK